MASETKVQNIQHQIDRKKRVLSEEEQRLVQIDIDLATTTANLKDQETALAPCKRIMVWMVIKGR